MRRSHLYRKFYRSTPYRQKVRAKNLVNKRKLLLHQRVAIEFLTKCLSDNKPGVLVDIPMGHGKTLIVLRMFLERFNACQVISLLFVTKQDVVAHIREELEKEQFPSQYLVVVKSYKDILKQKPNTTTTTAVPSYDMVVFDESHDVFKKSRLVEQLRRYVHKNFVILLTGSAGSQREIQKQWNVLVSEGEPIVFRARPEHLKRVVKNANEYTIQLQLTESQQLDYENQKQVIKQSSKSIEKVNCMRTLRKKLSYWKLEYVRTILVDAIFKKLKIAVFSEFANILVELRLLLPSKSIVVCDGSVSPRQRRIALKEFSSDTAKHVLIASSKLLSHGVDLGYCNGLIHLEPPWLRHTQQQTNARIVRIGQVTTQEILFLLFRDTMEIKLLASNNHIINI
jgi:superfamily II DNA or RNA helicase